MGRELGARSWVAENPGHCAGKLGLTAGSWALERIDMPTKGFNSSVSCLSLSVKVREGVWQMGGHGWAWSPAARAQVPTLRNL